MLKKISLNQITRNPDQPRQNFDPVALGDLAESIRINGLKQPITVRPMPEDADGHRYMVVMGERRFRAHKLLEAAGHASQILCQVREMGDEEMHIDAILENLQRAEVSPIEEAVAYQRAIDVFGIQVPELAKRLGISQHRRITDRIGLLGLTADNRQLLTMGIITPTQGWHMARLSPGGQGLFLALIKQGLVSTNTAAAEAAAAIQTKEDQSTMFGDEDPTPPRSRASAKSIEDKIDAIGVPISAMFKDGGVHMPDGLIDATGAQACIEKIKLLRASLGQIERELTRAASVSAVS